MRTLNLLYRIRKGLKKRGYVYLGDGELSLLNPALLRVVHLSEGGGGYLREKDLPLVEEAIREHKAAVEDRAEAALRWGDDKALRRPVWRGVLGRPIGGPPLREGVLALVLSEEAPPPPRVVIVENLEAFYRFDPSQLAFLPKGSSEEAPLREGPLTLLFRGGGGFREEGVLALARRAKRST